MRHFFELLLLLKLHQQRIILWLKSIVGDGIAAHTRALIITFIELLELIGDVGLYCLIAPIGFAALLASCPCLRLHVLHNFIKRNTTYVLFYLFVRVKLVSTMKFIRLLKARFHFFPLIILFIHVFK
jgi:hypothetical protein